MPFANPSHAYKRVAAQTAPPGQLVLMLYEGAIRFLEHALAGFGLDDPAEFNQTISNNVLRAQEIIRELSRCLDLGSGGELARQLERLYDYFDRRLMESNMKKEPEGIRDVMNRVSTLRNAWAAMLKGENDSLVSASSAQGPFELTSSHSL
ncbi:MAG: flagellar export chaperone FliS [Verrucomicrobiota bacterium]